MLEKVGGIKVCFPAIPVFFFPHRETVTDICAFSAIRIRPCPNIFNVVSDYFSPYVPINGSTSGTAVS